MPPWLEQVAENEFYRYPLEYNHRILDGAPAFFGRCLYNRATGVELDPPRSVSNILDCMVMTVLPQHFAQYSMGTMERVVINGMTSANDPGAHTDYDEDYMWTMVYMLLGCSGDLIVGQERIQYQPHRMCIFPSNQMHRALPPDGQDWRVTIAASFSLNLKQVLGQDHTGYPRP